MPETSSLNARPDAPCARIVLASERNLWLITAVTAVIYPACAMIKRLCREFSVESGRPACKVCLELGYFGVITNCA